MLDIIRPALLRAVIYLLPLLLGALFTWLAAMGLGVYNEAAGTLTVTLTITQIVGVATIFLGAPAVALTALLKRWRGL